MNRNVLPTAALAVESGAGGPRQTRGRATVAGVCTIAAIFLAFAVGAPWLLRDAPPDTYVVVATSAACAASHIAPGDCKAKGVKIR